MSELEGKMNEFRAAYDEILKVQADTCDVTHPDSQGTHTSRF